MSVRNMLEELVGHINSEVAKNSGDMSPKEMIYGQGLVLYAKDWIGNDCDNEGEPYNADCAKRGWLLVSVMAEWASARDSRFDA